MSAIDNLIIREPKLILRNVNSKAEVLLNLREESGALESKMQSSTKDNGSQVRFYLPRVSALSQGEYVIEGIKVELGVRGQSRGTVVTMPFVNPFQASAAKPLMVKVREGKVATVARVVQTTSIAEAAQGLSLKSVSENLTTMLSRLVLLFKIFPQWGKSFCRELPRQRMIFRVCAST